MTLKLCVTVSCGALLSETWTTMVLVVLRIGHAGTPAKNARGGADGGGGGRAARQAVGQRARRVVVVGGGGERDGLADVGGDVGNGSEHRRIDDDLEGVGGAEVGIDGVEDVCVGDKGGDGVGAVALGQSGCPGDDAARADRHAGGRVEQGVGEGGVDVGFGGGVGDGEQGLGIERLGSGSRAGRERR